MARVDVTMPQMGESIAEGTLSKWLKKVGDHVKRDEPIFEISTDKVDAEIPAPTAGTLAEILVPEGKTVAVQTLVARLETDKGAAVAASCDRRPHQRRLPPAPPTAATTVPARAPDGTKRAIGDTCRSAASGRAGLVRGAPPVKVLAARPQDGRRARRRHHRAQRQWDRRSRDQA